MENFHRTFKCCYTGWMELESEIVVVIIVYRVLIDFCTENIHIPIDDMFILFANFRSIAQIECQATQNDMRQGDLSSHTIFIRGKWQMASAVTPICVSFECYNLPPSLPAAYKIISTLLDARNYNDLCDHSANNKKNTPSKKKKIDARKESNRVARVIFFLFVCVWECECECANLTSFEYVMNMNAMISSILAPLKQLQYIVAANCDSNRTKTEPHIWQRHTTKTVQRGCKLREKNSGIRSVWMNEYNTTQHQQQQQRRRQWHRRRRCNS